ncbi:hypothetical protein EBZ37_08235 [bacterium]|nr:hypothetical protein [bacterium]
MGRIGTMARNFSLVALFSALLWAGAARAHGPFVSTTAALLAIDFALTATSLGASAATTASDDHTIALAVLEEAAHYYQSGEMTGLLPAAVKRLRELEPALSDASDNQIVGVLVDAVQSKLN